MTDEKAQAQVAAIEAAMAEHARLAWRFADDRRGHDDHGARVIHADALTRWSERLRLAMQGALVGDEEWLADAARLLATYQAEYAEQVYPPERGI